MKPHPVLLAALLAPLATAETTVLFIAGPASHGAGIHEHPAGCELLAKHLETSGLDIKPSISLGWPKDAAQVSAADTLVIFGDGQDAHPAKGQLDALRARLKAGKGLAILHYALEPTAGDMGQLLLDTIGGRFEVDWSVNPIWKMKDPVFAKHPAARGLSPFATEGEFYYHIRLRDDVTHLFRALPPADSLGNDGPRSGNPAVRKALADKIPQTLGWVVENATGARGFGFTGGHFHANWNKPDFRKLVLNGIAWTAGVEIPAAGVVGKVAITPAYETIDQAIAKDDINDVRLHLQANPDILKPGASKRPALDQAILRNKTEITLLLLESGADPNAAGSAGRTPLHLAVARGNAEIVTALMKAGAKPDIRDKSGWTPLHHAAAKDQVDVTKALLTGGANPMTLSELGGTPLHEAAASGSAELIRLLLDAKVDPTIKSKQGVTALDLAKEYKNQPAVDALSGK